MKKYYLILLMTAVIFTACNDDDDPVATGMLNLSINNLGENGAGELYEGWLIVDGTPVSTGTFSVDASGTLSQTSFTVDAADLSSATAFVLSLEPDPDPDPAPSAIKVLGGDFSGTSASVSVAHGAALGDDFSSAAGKVILATPTTESTDDENSGMWFLDLSSGMPATGLTLPTLPAGWKYEGWAVIGGSPITSGTFSSVDGADDAAPFSGPNGGPPFPGEDFVANAPSGQTFPTDLAGGTLVISIEPSPDNSEAPFMFKPLVINLAQDATDHVTYDLTNQVSSTFPSGTVSR